MPRARLSTWHIWRYPALWAALIAWLVVRGVSPCAAAAPDAGDSVDLTEQQVKAIRIGTAQQLDFSTTETAIGSIDFDEDLEAQIFPPYQGKVLQIFVRSGDNVRKAQVLFTIDSPDLVQAESTLISADAQLRLTSRALARAKDLYHTHGLAEKDYDQAVSDQQTADGALRAARDAVRIFGKSDGEIDRIAAARRVDPALVVRSPIDGVVIARNAAPGVFVQPGTAPAPLTVADTSTMWMLASPTEDLSASFKVGQPVSVQVAAYAGHPFTGRVAAVGSAIDPSTRRFILRSEVADPDHKLRSGMFAEFTIVTGDPVRSPAVPMNGVVREGDGTESIWVTTDRRHFVRRSVVIGRQQNGYRQIVSGLREGELVVTDGAVFLSNMLTADPT